MRSDACPLKEQQGYYDVMPAEEEQDVVGTNPVCLTVLDQTQHTRRQTWSCSGAVNQTKGAVVLRRSNCGSGSLLHPPTARPNAAANVHGTAGEQSSTLRKVGASLCVFPACC
jgi:hypothetical protein